MSLSHIPTSFPIHIPVLSRVVSSDYETAFLLWGVFKGVIELTLSSIAVCWYLFGGPVSFGFLLVLDARGRDGWKDGWTGRTDGRTDTYPGGDQGWWRAGGSLLFIIPSYPYRYLLPSFATYSYSSSLYCVFLPFVLLFLSNTFAAAFASSCLVRYCLFWRIGGREREG